MRHKLWWYRCPILYRHTYVTFTMVSQNLHDLLHITFILFASACTTYVSTLLVFSSDTDSLHLLHFVLIICAWRQSVPSNDVLIWDLIHNSITFRQCYYPKYTVGCLVFTIPRVSYFWAPSNPCHLSKIFLFKRQSLQLWKSHTWWRLSLCVTYKNFVIISYCLSYVCVSITWKHIYVFTYWRNYFWQCIL